MTETAATTGTSADSAGRDSADEPALTEETSPATAATGKAGQSAPADGASSDDSEPTRQNGADAAAGPIEFEAGDSAAGDSSLDSGATGAGAAAPGSGAVPAEAPKAAPDGAGAAAAPAGDDDKPPAKPAFTRPPGMVPPPDRIEDVTPPGGGRAGVAPVSGTPASGPPSPTVPFPGAYSTPVSAPPRVTGRQPAPNAVTMRPVDADGSAAVGAAPIGEPMRPRPTATPRGPRRARLHLKRVDPWSVMKFSFAVSLVLFIVVIVASSVLYLALDAMGVFASVNDTVAELISGAGEGNAFRITAQGVIGTAAVLGALNVLLFTSLATLGAFIYNVCADLVGGVEVTLAERD